MKKNESGRTMLEMMCVLGIIAIISLAAINGYKYMMTRYYANKTVETVSEFINYIRQIYSSQEDFFGLDNEAIISTGVIPDSYIGNNNKLVNPYGGGFFNIFYSNRWEGQNDEMDVSAAVLEVGNIARKTCLALAAADWKSGSLANSNSEIAAVVASTKTTTSSAGSSLIFDNSRSVLTDAGKNIDVIYDGDDQKHNSSYLGIGAHGNTKGYGIPMRPDIAATGCKCINDEGVDTFTCSFAIKIYMQ